MSLLCVVVITKNKDNTFFYRFLSRVVLKERRKKEEKYGKKGGNENVMMIRENHKTTNFVVRDLPLFQRHNLRQVSFSLALSLYPLISLRFRLPLFLPPSRIHTILENRLSISAMTVEERRIYAAA
ncbi:hypothetical protein YC2023_015082 [Brassica napus]